VPAAGNPIFCPGSAGRATIGLTAPDILLALNLFQLGWYQRVAEEIRRMLLSPDASLESARWLAANLQVESQRAALDVGI
jgi:hypothetical protein